jgi:hypothetical protein
VTQVHSLARSPNKQAKVFPCRLLASLGQVCKGVAQDTEQVLERFVLRKQALA